MGWQAFRLGQFQRSRRERIEAIHAGTLDAHPLHEILKAEARAEARRPACRQNMVGAGHIIAQRFRRMVAKEDRTGMTDLWQQQVRVMYGEFKVLGRDLIGDVSCLVERPGQDDRPVIGPCLLRAFFSGEGFQLLFHSLFHSPAHSLIHSNQDRLG